jgi:hypothetical protein
LFDFLPETPAQDRGPHNIPKWNASFAMLRSAEISIKVFRFVCGP